MMEDLWLALCGPAHSLSTLSLSLALGEGLGVLRRLVPCPAGDSGFSVPLCFFRTEYILGQ